MCEQRTQEDLSDQIARLNKKIGRLEAIVDNMRNPMTLFTPEGLALEMNRAAAEIFRGKPGDFIGKPLGEFLGNHADEHLKRFGLAVETGETRHYEDKTGTDENPRWHLSSYIPFEDPESGQLLVQVVSTDITDSRLDHQKLEESERKYRAVVDGSLDAIFLTAPDGAVFHANPAACDMFQMTLEELVRGGRNAVMDLDDPRLPHALEERRKKGFFKGELRFKRKNGTLFPAEVSSMVFKDEHGNERTSLAIRDLTENKNMEKRLLQSHKMEALGAMATGVAHEFNNILAIILGAAELASDDADTKDADKKYFMEILAAGNRGKDILNNLLRLSEKKPQNHRPINPKSTIEDCLKLMRVSIPKNVELRFLVHDDSRMVMSSAARIQHAVINLCRNAIQAMEKNGGLLEVEISGVNLDADNVILEPGMRPGSYVKVSVRDTGCGIDPAVMDRIFDPYFTTRGPDGIGMGLAIVYRIARDHDGCIRAFSQPGKGSTFDLYFPSAANSLWEKRIAEETAPTGNERILFVDDEKTIVSMACQRLTRLGYTVEGFEDPELALQRYSRNPGRFDLVITDMAMPKMNGERLATEIFKIAPDARIILCTGYSEKINAEKALAMGLSAFLRKPVDRFAMARAIRKVLDG